MSRDERDGLYRRPGSAYWWCRWWIDGVEHRRSTRTTDEEAAAVEARRIRVEIEQQTGAVGSRRRSAGGVTLRDLAAWDVERSAAAGHVSRHTDSVEIRWVRLAEILGADTSPASITSARLDRYVAARRAAGTRGQTIRRELQALQRGYRLARRRGHRYPEPEWPSVRSDPRDDRRRGHLRPLEDVRAVLAELPDDARDRLTVALLTGMRDGELLRLRYDWIERLPDGAPVPALLRLPESGTKDREERVIPLPAEALAILDRRRTESPQDGRIDDGRAFTVASHKKALATACERAGLPYRLTLRDLRHTYSTLAAAGSGDLTAVRDILGHADLRTTSLYQSSTLERLASAAAAVAAQLGTPAQRDRHSDEKKKPRPSRNPLESGLKVARPGRLELPTYGFEGQRGPKKSTG